jgi:hypothetical protein
MRNLLKFKNITPKYGGKGIHGGSDPLWVQTLISINQSYLFHMRMCRQPAFFFYL